MKSELQTRTGSELKFGSKLQAARDLFSAYDKGLKNHRKQLPFLLSPPLSAAYYFLLIFLFFFLQLHLPFRLIPLSLVSSFCFFTLFPFSSILFFLFPSLPSTFLHFFSFLFLGAKLIK